MSSYSFDADGVVVALLALAALAAFGFGAKLLAARPRRTEMALGLLLGGMVLAYLSYFWATFQLRLF